mmetsp:Transcript_34038/g.42003  ORF Transcript_34038/g.42003 Transcript_34038/m.42003 type:complete len:106 (+) Transcript_34038:1246-1563(+)|eukprot:CAMPEP_0170459814 /NCGR_PEP_ID=MMETSP0123-20130129/6372_1 /TAXON_ID=182087 /ORGANISM="Favella ehrenbergii, Strain Fehren 1" /LENGTH=105 /DNA_ID=CAMNT_0010724515 /DNA_START=1168 /DNA_END=1485 /DNA_ORIENTATION=+
MMEEPKTYRLESVKHAKEGHLGPGGILGGLANAAAKESSLHSFSERDEQEDENSDDDEGSYTSTSRSPTTSCREETGASPATNDEGKGAAAHEPEIDYKVNEDGQ